MKKKALERIEDKMEKIDMKYLFYEREHGMDSNRKNNRTFCRLVRNWRRLMRGCMA